VQTAESRRRLVHTRSCRSAHSRGYGYNNGSSLSAGHYRWVADAATVVKEYVGGRDRHHVRETGKLVGGPARWGRCSGKSGSAVTPMLGRALPDMPRMATLPMCGWPVALRELVGCLATARDVLPGQVSSCIEDHKHDDHPSGP
jgi:hypothetical protein